MRPLFTLIIIQGGTEKSPYGNLSVYHGDKVNRGRKVAVVAVVAVADSTATAATTTTTTTTTTSTTIHIQVSNGVLVDGEATFLTVHSFIFSEVFAHPGHTYHLRVSFPVHPSNGFR